NETRGLSFVGTESGSFLLDDLVLLRTHRPRHEDVETAEKDTDYEQAAAHDSDPIHGHQPHHGLNEIRVSEAPRLVERAPHQALSYASRIDGHDVEKNTQGPDPEMQFRELL